jgi:hypothetical protein
MRNADEVLIFSNRNYSASEVQRTSLRSKFGPFLDRQSQAKRSAPEQLPVIINTSLTIQSQRSGPQRPRPPVGNSQFTIFSRQRLIHHPSDDHAGKKG